MRRCSNSLWFSSLLLILLLLLVVLAAQDAGTAPAPEPRPPSALLFVPKKASRDETIRYRRQQMALVKDHSVLQWALLGFETSELPCIKKQKEPIDWLRQKLKIEYLDGTGVLRISLTAGNRREQACLVNAVAQSFIQAEVRPRQPRQEKCLELLKEMLKVYKQQLPTADREDKKNLEIDIAQITARLASLRAELQAPPQLLELADEPPH